MSPKLTPLCLALSLFLVPFIGVLQVKGAEPGLDLLDEESEDDFLTQLEQGEGNDYDLLQYSHLSELHRWEGVKRSRRHKGEDFRWRVIVLKDYPGRNLIKPVNGKTITDRIRVPESRAYRIWLGYLAEEKATPVEVKMSGANSHVFKYGAKDLPRKPGKTLENERPIRFDSERERMASAVSAKNMIWEYRDVSLEAGTTRLSVSSESPRATLDSVFITASRDFSPSKDTLRGNLNRTYVRFRVVESKQETDSTPISERLTYHWYHIPDGHSRPLWYSSLRSWEPDHVKGPLTGRPGERRLPVGEWTRWIDATEALVATGRFATERFSFDDVQEGVAEVQMSWFTHPAATMRSARPRIAESTAMVTIPVARRGYRAPTAGAEDENGVWGMRADDYLKWVETPTKIQARQRRWADEIFGKLGAHADNPTPDPRYIKLYTPARPFPPACEETAAMLADLGINWVHGLPWQISQEYGLLNGYFTHLGVALYFADTPCPSDPRTPQRARTKFGKRAERYDQKQPDGHEKVLAMKLGDEIGAVTGGAHINQCSDCLRKFHKYLRQTLKRMGKDASFFGVRDMSNLRYMSALPDRAGRYQRRLFYHSEKFKFHLTNTFYREITRAAEEVFPNVRTYCNYSPGGPMYAGHMNNSPWFVLARGGGVSLAWGEDWLYSRRTLAGVQTVSYYGALVECAARERNLPAGFYNVASCRHVDRKMFSLFAHGIFYQNIYSFGPLYAVVGAVDSWSQRQEVYLELARAARAVGPAQKIISEGARPPARIALLYNRTHEMWNRSDAGFYTDRLMTFLALQHAHLPVDIILEQDLQPELLQQYRTIYVQGYNMARSDVETLYRWVKNGGTLVGIAGTAMRDRYNEPMEAGDMLFGAKQTPAGCSEGHWWPRKVMKHKPIGEITVSESMFTPELQAPVLGARARLHPDDGKKLAEFEDGSCAAVINRLGKGQALLLGVMPGHIYSYTARWQDAVPHYRSDVRELITRPALGKTHEQKIHCSEPLVEVCLFENDNRLAVTLCDFTYEPGNELTLSINAGRKIKTVRSTMGRDLSWKQDDENQIVVHGSVPEPVDVLILE